MLLALVPVIWCAAQTAATDVPGSVTGAVTNSVTGAPILRSHVVVRLTSGADMGSTTYGALTNAEGKFTIAKLPAGSYMVGVDRVGFVAPAGGSVRSVSFTLSPGEKKEDLKLTLIPTGAILGRVLDSSGEPMQGVLVQAMGPAGQSTSTDEQGRYRIGGLRPGKYRVRASLQSMPFGAEIRTDGTREIHYATTWYSGTLTRATAQRVDVQPGAPLNGIDIRLISTPLVIVSGKVSGIPTGSVRTGIQVTRVGEEDSGGGSEGFVKADGTFTVAHLDPGKYTLMASSFGRGGPQRSLESAPVEIDVAGTNIEHIELRMVAPFEIHGRVRFDDDRVRMPPAPPRAPGQTAPPPPPVQGRQIRLEAVAGFMGRGVSAEIDTDDTFVLENVQAGRYRVMLSWGPGYVKSVSLGPTETEGDDLDLSNGVAAAVTISVSGLTCDISGTVNGAAGGPAGGGRVIISPTAQSRNFLRMVETKPDGTYALTGLPPGKYKLAATAGDYSPDLMQPGEPVDDDEADVQIVELRAGDKLTKDLKLK